MKCAMHIQDSFVFFEGDEGVDMKIFDIGVLRRAKGRADRNSKPRNAVDLQIGGVWHRFTKKEWRKAQKAGESMVQEAVNREKVFNRSKNDTARLTWRMQLAEATRAYNAANAAGYYRKRYDDDNNQD